MWIESSTFKPKTPRITLCNWVHWSPSQKSPLFLAYSRLLGYYDFMFVPVDGYNHPISIKNPEHSETIF
jgi:hypothetical protein